MKKIGLIPLYKIMSKVIIIYTIILTMGFWYSVLTDRSGFIIAFSPFLIILTAFFLFMMIRNSILLSKNNKQGKGWLIIGVLLLFVPGFIFQYSIPFFNGESKMFIILLYLFFYCFLLRYLILL